MIIKNKITSLLCGISLFMGFNNSFVYAENAEVRFHGLLVDVAPCETNNSNPVQVDFGDEVFVTRIENDYYSRDVDFSFDCDTATIPELQIKIEGETVDFNTEALKTDTNDLAVIFYNGDKLFELNRWFLFSYKTPPKLRAVLIKNDNVELSGSHFTAQGSLIVDYQ